MITAQIETMADALEEARALFPVHYHEISQHKAHGIPLEPNYAEYVSRETSGELLFVTLREDGRLIGYFVGFIIRELHYRSSLALQMDIIFVEPGKRGMSGGKALCDAVEKEAKRRGVGPWKMGFKEEFRPHMEAMLTECGFAPFERTYVKWLGD